MHDYTIDEPDEFKTIKDFIKTVLGDDVLTVELTNKIFMTAYNEARSFDHWISKDRHECPDREPGRKSSWVRDYTLARCMWTLGCIRSKWHRDTVLDMGAAIDLMRMGQSKMDELRDNARFGS